MNEIHFFMLINGGAEILAHLHLFGVGRIVVLPKCMEYFKTMENKNFNTINFPFKDDISQEILGLSRNYAFSTLKFFFCNPPSQVKQKLSRQFSKVLKLN